jgi:uncharacterized protein
MKLQPDKIDTLAVTGYGKDWIAISGERHSESQMINSKGERVIFSVQSWESLRWEDFEPLVQWAQQGIELLVFGTGDKQRFLPPQWMVKLNAAGLGVESMNTPAACRTFNILAGEGRAVAAVLMIEHTN